MLARVIWRSLSPSTPLETHSRMTQIVAIAAHHLMYMLIFAVMISGYLIATADGKPISVFGWFTLPALLSGEGEQADIAGRVHLWLAWGLIGLSALHALAALKHHFIDKDATLSRMLSKS